MRCFLDRCRKHPKIKFFKHKFNIPSFDVPNQFETPANFELFLEWLGYADDTLLLLEDDDSIQLVYNIYEQTLTEFFLKVNPTKTKTQVINYKHSEKFNPESTRFDPEADPNEYPSSIIGFGTYFGPDKIGPEDIIWTKGNHEFEFIFNYFLAKKAAIF